MHPEAVVAMVFGVLLSSVSQVLLKKSANKTIESERFLNQYLNPYVLGGYALLCIALIIPFWAYRYIDLKYGAVIESLGYVFIMVLSPIFLNEKITTKKLLGNSLIVLGVVVFSNGAF